MQSVSTEASAENIVSSPAPVVGRRAHPALWVPTLYFAEGLPMVTVAALQGHTFAAGAMLSLCHDLRIMRADRGYWCLPEADINIPFSVGMSALIQSRLTPPVAHEAMVTARRFGGEEAYTKQIVDEAVAEPEVRQRAIALAQQHAPKAGPALQTIKQRMYAPVLAALGAEGENAPDAALFRR